MNGHGLTTLGPMGLTRFRHAKRIALEDLLYLVTSMSGNVAGDGPLRPRPFG